ncbi:hypothetical protein KUTeg_005657 [Tegillarca granosa]|uniref:RING-type domain-containing protein n=1 Tax=Tegillarca granosa TaxID=220873 RepID=A0ABQ9FKB5_TEGGR|nr:hypothetical protein KUTeg_005657 [Tegillarca granosa]
MSPWSSDVLVDVVMRVPTLYMMDSILNKSFLSEISIFHYSATMSWMQFFRWLFLMSTLFMVAFGLFLLSNKQLMDIYSYLLSMIVMLVSYFCNLNFMKAIYTEEINKFYPENRDLWILIKEDPMNVTKILFIHLTTSFLFTKIWKFRNFNSRRTRVDGEYAMQIWIFFSFIFPLLLRAVYQDLDWFMWSPVIALTMPFVILTGDTFKSFSMHYQELSVNIQTARMTIQTLGIQSFLENQWIRLHVPKVLRMFWCSRFVFHFIYYFYAISTEYIAANIDTTYYDYQLWRMIVKILMIRSCDTTVSLLGLTSIVSCVAHYFGILMAFCVGSESEEDRNMGTVSAVLFFILALQTGLTGLEPEKRLVRLSKNFCLLFTAISHFIHSMVHPLLMSISAQRNTNLTKHIRILAMCAFLITFPICLLVYLWSEYSASTWLLAVSAFSIEVIMKVTVSLTVYVLFMLDAYRVTFWEKLDDYVYYVQSTGNTIEFLFGIFLFCNGAWIMIFESGGFIRAVMMCIHAYFNIWVQAKEGWKVFMNRRTAVKKINSLPEATEETLRELNDVCAICYQDLNTARVTPCHHYFHGVCLRKWLYFLTSSKF